MSDSESPKASGSARNLYQRVCDIKAEVQVKWTGKTAQNQKEGAALSIADVDKALGDAMGTNGVYSTYTFLAEPRRLENGRDWRVFIRGYLVNADNPIRRGGEGGESILGGDFDSADLYDDGSSISAAVSFALKRWQREVFKLAEDDTSAPAAGTTQQAQRQDFTPPRHPEPAPPPPAGATPDPAVPRYSAAQLASRAPLYAAAERLGKSREAAEAWVNALLDVPQPDGNVASVGSIRKKLEKEEAKRGAQQGETKPSEPQDGAKEAEPVKDMNALVCPFCGNADAPGDLPAPGKMCCFGGKGGCGQTFDGSERTTRGLFAARLLRGEVPAGALPPSELEELVAEAGFCPLCGLRGEHAPDCISLEARLQRGEIPMGAAS